MDSILKDKVQFHIIESNPCQSHHELWKMLYQKYFNRALDVKPFDNRQDYWPIVIAKGMKLQQVFETLARCFKVYKYTNENLDAVVTENDRNSKTSYVIWVKVNIEADEKFKNKSASDLKREGHIGITLLERLLLELFYFTLSKGRHLDRDNWTLCVGSRDSDGNVPRVDWDGGRLRVDWYRTSLPHLFLRSRSVVS